MKKIIASLSYGRVFSAFLFTVVILGGVLSLVAIALSIFMAIDEGNNFILIILFLPVLVLGCCVYILIYQIKLRSKIKEWTKDAIELKARSKIVDSIIDGAVFKKYKIKVSFQYNGRVIVKESGIGKNGTIIWGSLSSGYDIRYRKYSDREIWILYSPKYDEVLLLKDKSI